MTKILILGNGFDLAHDLPTSYSMFLNFCERFIDLINDDCNWTETEFDDGINFILNNFEQERKSKIIDKFEFR